MPFNGVGLFVRLRNWVADAAAGVKIRADYHDLEDDGFATGLSQCITKDGQTTILQNIPMNGKRIVAMADPVNPQDAATKAYADLKLPLAGGTITGTLDVTGQVGALGYKTRAGQSGAFGGNLFNFQWTGNLQAWVDSTNIGNLATTAYVETSAAAWAHAIADPKVNRAGDTMTGALTSAVSGNLGTTGLLNSFVVMGSAGDWAGVTFHTPGSFVCNFGMHPSGDFYQGGGSLGANVLYKFWTTRNLNPIQDGRLAFAGQAGFGPAISEPFGGAVATGFASGLAGNPATTARWRYMQLLTPSGWYTVGYV